MTDISRRNLLGAGGQLHCVDLKTGKKVWSKEGLSNPYDAQRLSGRPPALGAIGVTVWLAVEEMRWHDNSLSGREQGSLAVAVSLGQHVEQRIGQVGQLLAGRCGGLIARRGQFEGQGRNIARVERK